MFLSPAYGPIDPDVGVMEVEPMSPSGGMLPGFSPQQPIVPVTWAVKTVAPSGRGPTAAARLAHC